MNNNEAKKIQRRVNSIIRNKKLGFFTAKFQKISHLHRCWTGEKVPGIAFVDDFTGTERSTISLLHVRSARKIVQLWIENC